MRRFAEKPLKADAVAVLNAEIAACNQESGLHLQLITEEPNAFQAGNEMNSVAEIEAFSCGFRLGVRLMIEAGVPLAKGTT